MTIEEKWDEIEEAQQLRNCAQVYRKRFARYADPADLRRANRYESQAEAIEQKYDRAARQFLAQQGQGQRVDIAALNRGQTR